MVKNLIKNIHASPTAFHAVKTASDILDKNGFVRLSEKEAWRLDKSGKYYIVRADSSLIAFVLDGKADAFNIVASHTDSCCFKLKGNPDMGGVLSRLNIEVYGSPIMSSWQDRKLKLAGRAYYADKNGVKGKLIESDYPVVIPNLALHLNREVNNGYKFNPQKDLLPVSGISKGDIKSLVGDALSYDLFAVCAEEGYTYGHDKSLIACPRLDNLAGVFSSLTAFVDFANSEYSARSAGTVKILALLDNEEIGSRTRQGAASWLLYDVLARINYAFGRTDNDLRCALARSMFVSLDNAHATHPSHPELSDPTSSTVLGGGIAVKHHANFSYTTDAESGALIKKLFKDHNIKYQDFYVRSDLRAGATLGPVNSGFVSINSVDIGMGQLAMHSAVETASVSDYEDMVKGMTAFYKHF